MLVHHSGKECSWLTFWALRSRLSIQYTKKPTLNLHRGILFAVFCILSSIMVSQLNENQKDEPCAVVPSTRPIVLVLCCRFAWTLKRWDRLFKKSTLTLTMLSRRQLSWWKTLAQLRGWRLHHFFIINILHLGWNPAIMCAWRFSREPSTQQSSSLHLIRTCYLAAVPPCSRWLIGTWSACWLEGTAHELQVLFGRVIRPG